MSNEPVSSRHPFTDVSALFDSVEAVETLLPRLVWAGVPRDLIEVVVTPAAAARFALPGRSWARETARYAGIGGLAGLIAGGIISLVMIALPGFASGGPGAVVQLLGPNLATLAGAAGGAVVGLFVRRRAERRHRRAETGEAILVVIRARGRQQVAELLRYLQEAGGRACAAGSQ